MTKPEQPGYLYYFHNKINGKLYIGESHDPKWRFTAHLNTVKMGKEKDPQHYQAIHAAITKYGIESFDFIVFDAYATEKDALKMEVFWIAFAKNWGYKLYNLTNGGEGASGRVVSEKTKRLIGEKSKKRCIGKGNPFYGRKHTEETKKLIGEKSKGRNVGEKNYWYGKPVSDERKQAMSERSKLQVGENNPFFGRKHTPETIEKIVVARRKSRPISREDVLTIRWYLLAGKKNAWIARKYEVDRSIISNIKRGKCYADIQLSDASTEEVLRLQRLKGDLEA